MLWCDEMEMLTYGPRKGHLDQLGFSWAIPNFVQNRGNLVQHVEANAMAPALDSFGEAGIRADIIIPKLKPLREICNNPGV